MEKEQTARNGAPAKAHSLSLENRQRAMLTGVSEVVLTGEGLHVTRLMLEEGQLAVEGKIDGVFYSQRSRRRGIFRRKNA